MKIRYSPRSVQDLAGIQRFLTERSPTGAVNVMTAIYAAIEFIRNNPEAAESTSISSIRNKVVHRYRFKVFYRVPANGEIIEILHVRHTSREPWTGDEC